MQIVIDIEDEYVLSDIKNRSLEAESETDKVIINALYNGTPLPKGHDYIDRNNAITSICQHYTICERMKMLSFTPNLIKQEVTDILCAVPTIIEADKAESEEVRNEMPIPDKNHS